MKHVLLDHHADISARWGGGGAQLFFGAYVPREFPKVRPRSGFSLKNEGSWERKNRNFASWKLTFWPKTRLKMHFFSKHWKWEVRERRIDGRLLSTDWSERGGGGSWLRHIPVTPSSGTAPGILVANYCPVRFYYYYYYMPCNMIVYSDKNLEHHCHN